MGDNKEAAPPISKPLGSVLTRAMTSPAMTSPSLATSLNKIPFKLLELRVIAAHDLPRVSKYLHTYVMAWVHPDNKMITPVDHKGNTNPMWNFRMVFGVDDKFLNSESSAIMMEIYNISKLSNRPIGTTCLPVDILLDNSHSEIMKRPLKLQISRPSGDLQGYLIVTLNLVTTTIRNLNEESENSPRAFNPRTIMIKQISQRLTHSVSAKPMTYYEDEEDHDDATTFSDPDGTTLSDPDASTLSDPDMTTLSDPEITTLNDPEFTTLSDPEITTLSDPESVSIDIETKSLASDLSSALKDSGMTSPNGENSGPGTSQNGEHSGPGTSQNGENSGPGSSPNGENLSPGTSPNGENSGPGTSLNGENSGPGTLPNGENSGPGTLKFNSFSEAEEQNTKEKADNVSEFNSLSEAGEKNVKEKADNVSEFNSLSEAGEKNTTEKADNVSEFNSLSEAGEKNTKEKADKVSKINSLSEAGEKNTKEKADNVSRLNSLSEAGEKSTKEKADNVSKLREDQVLIKGDEKRLRSRHRRHSDGGGLLSFFTTAIICGTGTMGTKHNKHKNRKLKKKSKSAKKSFSHAMDYPPDEKKLPHDI